MSIFNAGIGSIVEGVGKIADDLFTSDEERLKMALKEKEIEADLIMAQIDTNKEEARHKSVFVAGWRPFIGWVGGFALAYQFILYPLLVWGWALFEGPGDPPPPFTSDVLYTLIAGMLGIGGMRSFDKLKKTDTTRVTR